MLKEFPIQADYWENIEINQEDLELLNDHLIEIETPLSPEELIRELIPFRIQLEQEKLALERMNGERIYSPKDSYKIGEFIVFPELDWQKGSVVKIRPGNNPETQNFQVAEVEFGGEVTRGFAVELNEHKLNSRPNEFDNSENPLLDPNQVIENYGPVLAEKIIAMLSENEEFVYIAGNWFPKALILEVNQGNLNLAEAMLDMVGGGPLSTAELISDVGLPGGVNPNLAEFSLDLALQEDERFDEVGPEGEVAWFLKKGEPEEVINTPPYLTFVQVDFDRETLSDEMIALEKYVDDELSPNEPLSDDEIEEEVAVRLIFPHWQAGTLPLTSRISRLFPTAYESARIRFVLKDGESGESFPGWVVRLERYVYGLGDWYRSRGLMPGSYVHVKHGEVPGEVIVRADSHRSNKEWVRTALVGADGGIVYATLKQPVSATFDERMMIYMPSDIRALEAAWKTEKPARLEEIVVATLRELAKLNPQRHVHVTELYSAVNLRMRTPPGPIMAFLASESLFSHVGDLHYRFEEENKD